MRVLMLADTMYLEFVEHPRMAAIRSRTVWVHVDVPGQGQDAADLPSVSVTFDFSAYSQHMHSKSLNVQITFAIHHKQRSVIPLYRRRI